MNNKLSVIVPVYNTEKYLSKCLNSIVNQSYKNLEILIINDGSTDGSLNIIKSLKMYIQMFLFITNRTQELLIQEILVFKKLQVIL